MIASSRFPVAALMLGATVMAMVSMPNARAQVPSTAPSTGPTTAPIAVMVTIDNGADGTPISPYIYGVAQTKDEVAKGLNVSTRRIGGNGMSAWNWKKGFSSSGSDWYYVNNPKDETKANLADKNWWLTFHRTNKALGIESYCTLPMMGRVAKDGTSVAFNIDKYPDQTDWEEKSHPNDLHPKAGNGKHKVKGADGKEHEEMYKPDLDDTSVVMTPAEQVELLHYCMTEGKLGAAKDGGIKYICLDNEPSLWNITHYGMHPDPMSYDELWDKTKTYATLAKQVDPDVKIAGMAAFGWTEYFYSGKDAYLIKTEPDKYNWKAPPDKTAHGDLPMTRWFLQQCAAEEKATGKRLIDVIDWHFYPQDGNWGKSHNPKAMEQRVQETRVLWDPTFKDPSWMGSETGKVCKVIRLLKEWINQDYPGTKTAIGEYNFSGGRDSSDGVAEAEVLGIFAREGLDFGYFWFTPQVDDATGCGFRLLRNPDRKNTAVGDHYLPSTVSDADDVSAHPYRAADGRLSLLLINKRSAAPRTVTLHFAKPVKDQEATAWRYTDAVSDKLLDEKVQVNKDTFEVTLPPISAMRVDITQ